MNRRLISFALTGSLGVAMAFVAGCSAEKSQESKPHTDAKLPKGMGPVEQAPQQQKAMKAPGV